jgi:hypothetical protein
LIRELLDPFGKPLETLQLFTFSHLPLALYPIANANDTISQYCSMLYVPRPAKFHLHSSPAINVALHLAFAGHEKEKAARRAQLDRERELASQAMGSPTRYVMVTGRGGVRSMRSLCPKDISEENRAAATSRCLAHQARNPALTAAEGLVHSRLVDDARADDTTPGDAEDNSEGEGSDGEEDEHHDLVRLYVNSELEKGALRSGRVRAQSNQQTMLEQQKKPNRSVRAQSEPNANIDIESEEEAGSYESEEVSGSMSGGDSDSDEDGDDITDEHGDDDMAGEDEPEATGGHNELSALLNLGSTQAASSRATRAATRDKVAAEQSGHLSNKDFSKLAGGVGRNLQSGEKRSCLFSKKKTKKSRNTQMNGGAGSTAHEIRGALIG